jgi:hypothetical protein
MIPRLRHGSYFPDCLLEHRRRAESALVTQSRQVLLSTRWGDDNSVGTSGLTAEFAVVPLTVVDFGLVYGI